MSRSQPPCPKVCWEHTGGVHGWRYVESVNWCGHWYDHSAGIWRWDNERERTPPPCDQVCWIPDTKVPFGWSYREPGSHCAHTFDKTTGEWAWVQTTNI